MHELADYHYTNISGGCGDRMALALYEYTGQKINPGAIAGSLIGIGTAYYYNARPLSYLPFIATAHFLGSMAYSAFRFYSLTTERMNTGNRSGNPIKDAFCMWGNCNA